MKTNFAEIGTLATQTAPYALIVAGNNLAPTITHGQRIAIMPCVDADPASIAPGSVILAAIEKADTPGAYDNPSLWKMNADRDLTSGPRTIEAGKYIVLGTATPNAPQLDDTAL